MARRTIEDERDAEIEASDSAADAPRASPMGIVDESVKRRLEEAYRNDMEDELIVVDVSSPEGGSSIAVEMETPHGDTDFTKYFDGPKHGSLEECEEFLRFLEVAGVSPLELEELIGSRIPASFDPESGWIVASEYAPERHEETDASQDVGVSARGRFDGWMKRNMEWLVLLILVGGELLIVAILIVLFA
ncbi:hypothetical protein [Halostagnicola sp. A-GB9-2]|uniref:hypothetical protein n=1 Tax=Halostagnicola sp. A-GB9-2 TaxID=3048066 RepID=UPI0024C0116B|nr:hypothetical protein [Halostagnicola sp. A-GB9-2]MDJ1432777.1 hypothetical protein [Halostagnicola sp. A-GB9-2]